MPMPARPARRRDSGSAVTSWPSTTTVPDVTGSSALMRRTSVDLPAPEYPMTPKTSPARTSSVTPSTARTSGDVRLAGKTLTTSRKDTIGRAPSAGAVVVVVARGPVCWRAGVVLTGVSWGAGVAAWVDGGQGPGPALPPARRRTGPCGSAARVGLDLGEDLGELGGRLVRQDGGAARRLEERVLDLRVLV